MHRTSTNPVCERRVDLLVCSLPLPLAPEEMDDRSLKEDTEKGLEGGETGLVFDNIDSGLVFDSELVSTSSLQARFDVMANDEVLN